MDVAVLLMSLGFISEEAAMRLSDFSATIVPLDGFATVPLRGVETFLQCHVAPLNIRDVHWTPPGSR